jgi:predicted MFS family arabinose efflux permease
MSSVLSISLPVGQGQPDVRRLASFFGVAYFIQGFADLSSGLTRQPVQYLLKEQLQLSAVDSGAFWAIVGLGWTLKPLYGFLSDSVPFAGYRRKSYLVLMALVSTLGWLVLARFSSSYTTLLCVLTLCAASLAFTDVITDALMVETGRPLRLTGSFQAIQWAALSFALILAQFFGGYLATHASVQSVFLLAAGFPLVFMVVTFSLVREPSVASSRVTFADTLSALRHATHTRMLWTSVTFLFLWNFSPSFGTPLLYYETDVLKFSKVFIGTLGAITQVGSVIGALLFLLCGHALPLRKLLTVAVALGLLSTLSFLGLVGARSAVALFFFSGMINQITHLVVLDLAARTCPVRAAGTVFALLMSTLNLGASSGGVFGGWLYESVGFPPLILISALGTALCWLIVPFIREANED